MAIGDRPTYYEELVKVDRKLLGSLVDLKLKPNGAMTLRCARCTKRFADASPCLKASLRLLRQSHEITQSPADIGAASNS